MKVKLLLSCVVLGNLLTMETVNGAGRKLQSMHHMDKLREENRMKIEASNKHIDQTFQNEKEVGSRVNNFHISFLREVQSNQVLCIDVTKIQDRVEAALTIAEKASVARSFLERYAAHIRSCDGDNANDIQKAEKSYAERNYEILQTVLLDPKKYGVLDIHIEYQEFSVPGSTTKYPRFCGFVIRK